MKFADCSNHGARRNSLLPTIVLLGLCTQQATMASAQPVGDALTKQALTQFKEGQLDGAVALEQKAIAKNPKRWLPHATLSYLAWQQGDGVTAQSEGEAAVRLSPTSTIALNNLAAIYEAMDDSTNALSLYERARHIDSRSLPACLGLIRCYSKVGRPKDSIAVAAEMNALDSHDFEWNFQLGQICLQLDELNLAKQAAARALTGATTREQKGKALEQSMMALLRDNSVEQARALQDQLFSNYSPTDYELYVRAVSLLPSVENPKSADNILNAATKNLTEVDDCDGFYRLGRVLQQKADEVNSDSTKSTQWTKYAETAFRQALALNPGMGKSYLALAGVLDRQGRSAEMSAPLKQATAIDGNGLSRYLQTINERGASNLALSLVEFKPLGLNCACHVGKLAAALRSLDGVAFVHITASEPYPGCLIIDESVTPVTDALAKAKTKAFAGMKESFASVTFEQTGHTPVTSAHDAIATAQKASDGDPLHFFHAFGGVQPSMPVESVASSVTR